MAQSSVHFDERLGRLWFRPLKPFHALLTGCGPRLRGEGILDYEREGGPRAEGASDGRRPPYPAPRSAFWLERCEDLASATPAVDGGPGLEINFDLPAFNAVCPLK